MEGVREALATAQEAGDTACLAHAAAWGALAGGRARRAALLTKMPRAPRPAAAAAQLLAQHAAVNGAKPSDVFQVSYYSFFTRMFCNTMFLITRFMYR